MSNLTITDIDNDRRDALRIWEHLVQSVALAGMYPDRVVAMVREMAEQPHWKTGLTARQRDAILELIAASWEDANV